MDIKVDLSTSGITSDVRDILREQAEDARENLLAGKLDFTGWVDLPLRLIDVASCEVNMIKATAMEINEKCDLFIVVGIGGSYMGAKAIIDALDPMHAGKVVFGGCNMSGAYHQKIIEMMQDKEVCLCVISKSGGTTEPLAAFSILKEEMFKKYGEQASSHIYAITDIKEGRLREEANAAGYQTFVVPGDIGGRYSVLSPVGLLPLAVAGVDVEGLMAGAADIATGFRDGATVKEDMLDYAMSRIALSKSGKWIEIFEYFAPELDFFGEWLKQLFGESEGKEGKGIFPASMMFTRDLHSMGQFIQQGKQMFFETMILTEEKSCDVMIPGSAGAPLAGKTLEEINDCATAGVIAAHTKAGVPVIKIVMERLDEPNIGALVYFFETACAVSALISGVDPFDQPGVEAYKNEMKAAIKNT